MIATDPRRSASAFEAIAQPACGRTIAEYATEIWDAGPCAVPVRARVCEDAAWLGVRLDPAANLRHVPRISTADSPVSVWVIPTDEEPMIARHTLACIRRGGPR